MELHLLTVIFGIFFTLQLSLVTGKNENEAAHCALNSPMHEAHSMLKPNELGFKGSETELHIQSKQHRRKTPRSKIYAERAFEYGSRARICPSENIDDVDCDKSKSKSKSKQKIPQTKDCMEDNDADDSGDATNDKAIKKKYKTHNSKQFKARVSCILQALDENANAISTDLKKLNSGIINPKTSRKCINKKKNKKPKKLRKIMLKEDVNNEVKHFKDAVKGERTKSSIPLKCVKKVMANEANTQLTPEAESHDYAPDLNYPEQQLDRIPLIDLQLPFMLPSASLLVPVLKRRPWSVAVPNSMERRRYLHALNELRLSRAIQEAAAARYNHKQRSSDAKERVDEFKENLRRLVSNREVIERKINALLVGIHNPV